MTSQNKHTTSMYVVFWKKAITTPPKFKRPSQTSCNLITQFYNATYAVA